MKQIVGAFATLLIIMVNAFVGIGLISAGGSVAAAKEYKADVIAEIENSNFNSYVINSCISQASDAGYTLSITNCTYDDTGNIQTAEIILSYDYTIPIFGISDTRSTRGIAR